MTRLAPIPATVIKGHLCVGWSGTSWSYMKVAWSGAIRISGQINTITRQTVPPPHRGRTRSPATCSHCTYAAHHQDVQHILKETRSIVCTSMYLDCTSGVTWQILLKLISSHFWESLVLGLFSKNTLLIPLPNCCSPPRPPSTIMQAVFSEETKAHGGSVILFVMEYHSCEWCSRIFICEVNILQHKDYKRTLFS